MLKILLTGKRGQLGWELERSLSPLGEVISTDRTELDLQSSENMRSVIRSVKPHLIINAAAYNNLDQAEKEPAIAFAVNAQAPGVLAQEAVKCGAGLIHFSTDYVFDGESNTPYLETDGPAPLSVYGKSKLEGERLVQEQGGAYLILRTAWMYSSRSKECFPAKVMAWMRSRERVSISQDQFGNPTWCRSLAEAVAMTLAGCNRDVISELKALRGVYHLAGTGIPSRFEWAQEIARLDPNPGEWLAKEILPGQSDDFPAPAVRPKYSALDCTKFTASFNLKLPEWRTALHQAFTTD